MQVLPRGCRELDLRAVRVRPTHGAPEHRRWDRLVARHHYLSFQGLFGKALRHVAMLGSTWIALLGWQAAALKLAARDRWIGWTPQQKRRRLHLVTQNSRFVILPGFHARNLASRVLGLSLRRLSDDMLAAHGFPVVLAETFVDPARFAGTCYRAANWRSLGRTGGYARQPGAAPTWRHHGQPKEILVYELQPHAAATLRQPAAELAGPAPPRSAPPETPQLRSLFECLSTVPEYRHARGKRYSLATVLALAVAARLAGYRGVTAFAQFADLLSQPQRQTVGCFYSPSRHCYTTPSITTFHNILATLPPDTLEDAVGEWVRQQSEQVPQNEPDTGSQKAAGKGRESGSRPQGVPAVCMDGKDVRGASKQTQDGRRMLVAAVEQGSGLVLGQLEIPSKTNEIPAVRELAGGLDLAERVVTADAMHAQHKTARCLLDDCEADYLITAIKDNQPTMLADLRAMDFSDCPTFETRDKEHGRIDLRRYWIKDLSDPQWDGKASLYGRRQALRIERVRKQVKSGETSTEVTYALTSLAPERATPEQLAALVRNHWHIENRLHYVRDLPRNLACLTNTAISIIRCQTGFRYVPVANRHFAARSQEALDLLLNPPTP